MSEKRRGLGRGLGSLIPTAPESPAPSADGHGDGVPVAPEMPSDLPVSVAGAYFAELPIDSITPNARQPREVFEEEAMAELVHSVKEIGLLQPIVVRQLSGGGHDGKYELIMGERRWRASTEAGLETILNEV